MTLFEYLSVAVSMIVALAFAQGLRGLHSALMSDRRYWVHLAWILIKLLAGLIYWWSIWGFRDLPEYWNITTYAFALAMPSLLYLQLFSLISDRPDHVTDWKQHFYEQRKWFFGLNVLLGLLLIFMWAVLIPAQRWIPVAGYSFITVLSVVGYVSEDQKVHAVIVTLVGGFTVFYYGVATFSPVHF